MTSIRILRSNHISIFKDFLGVVALLVSCFCSSPFYSNTFSTFSPLFLKCTFFCLTTTATKEKTRKPACWHRTAREYYYYFCSPRKLKRGRSRQLHAVFVEDSVHDGAGGGGGGNGTKFGPNVKKLRIGQKSLGIPPS